MDTEEIESPYALIRSCHTHSIKIIDLEEELADLRESLDEEKKKLRKIVDQSVDGYLIVEGYYKVSKSGENLVIITFAD